LVLKAAVAHLWFVTIHPFEDGNGRIARAIADLLLARSEKSSQRFYSMSAQIREERKVYYDILSANATSAPSSSRPPSSKAGWDEMRRSARRSAFTKGRIIVRGKLVTRGKAKRADYILYYKPNIPLALIEAKDNNHSVGDGMQQGLEYAMTLNIPFVFSSNGDGFVFHDRTGSRRRDRNKPRPRCLSIAGRTLGTLSRLEGTDAGRGTDRPSGLFRRRQRQGPALLPGQRRQRRHRSHRQRPEPHPARDGDRHRQDLHRVSDHLAAYGRPAARNASSSRRPQRADRPDDGERLPPIRRGDGKAQHECQDHRTRDGTEVELTLGARQETPHRHSYEIYLGLYQAITGPEERQKLFREFSPGFFDLIVIDECHRGSAAEDSAWREILEYFSGCHADRPDRHAEGNRVRLQHRTTSATRFTPTRSSKAFATAFSRPTRWSRSISTETWKATGPRRARLDRDGEEVEDRIYNTKDFDRTLVLDDRTKLTAKKITDFLKESGDRFQKTIVFCVDQEHAARMRQALINENADLVAENHRYVMRITGNDKDGAGQLGNFHRPGIEVSRLVTTSRLLSTGVDAQTCRLIVLDREVGSMTEFKQIVGRGTRVHEDTKKFYFTLIDFRGATSHFADPDFDGEPVQIYEPGRVIPSHRPTTCRRWTMRAKPFRQTRRRTKPSSMDLPTSLFRPVAAR
jgi:type I restriction enzyme R subunit